MRAFHRRGFAQHLRRREHDASSRHSRQKDAESFPLRIKPGNVHLRRSLIRGRIKNQGHPMLHPTTYGLL